MTPASIRNNNPGGMYPGPSARKFGSRSHEVLHSKDGEHKIATFPDGVSGAAAMFDLLASPAYTGRTLAAAIRKWCGGFRPETYLHVLQSRAGVTGDTPLTAELVRDPVFAIPLCKAMAVQEAGREFPLSDADWGAAHSRAFGAPADTKIETAVSVPPAPKPLPKSGTIWGSAGAAVAGVGVYVEQSLQAVLDTASKWAELTPIRAMFGDIRLDGKAVTLGLLAGCVVLIVSRRVKAGQEGKAG